MYPHSMEKNPFLCFIFVDFFSFYSMHLSSKEATIHFSVNFGQFFGVNVLCSVFVCPKELHVPEGLP